ncbi:MAG: di-heme oxidoredictase family protein [Steroidobacteraceae bacterium]
MDKPRSSIVNAAAVAVVLSLPWIVTQVLAETRSAAPAAPDGRMERFRSIGTPEAETTTLESEAVATGQARPGVTEAPTGFDNQTNGFSPQGPDFETLHADNVVPLRSFNDNRFIFEEAEFIADGLGPTYNAQSCRECHQNVVTGGASQIAEHRTGRMDGNVFFESLGGSLVHSRATHADIVERVEFEDDIRTFRISTNTLGNGFVEAIANSTLLAIRDGQPASLRGTALPVPVLEAGSVARIGRFGWKSQHASLESFSADAYLNEMGITTPLFPDENASSGEWVGYGSGYDYVDEPEDDGIDVVAFANFMRATKAPSRGKVTADVRTGERLFAQIGCDACHVPSITTAPPGTAINGGAMKVPKALGNKVIHPYSDFLLHDIGTGDGIPFLPQPEFAATAKQIRTAPLWALRTRNRLMHDGLSSTKEEAIERHAGQAAPVTEAFKSLSAVERAQLLEFLDSL